MRPRSPVLGACAVGVVAAALVARRRLADLGADSAAAHRDRTGAPFPLETAPRSVVGIGPGTRLTPSAREPALFVALANWVPGPPGGALARALAYVWAAPVTLAGLLAGAASGVVPRIRDGVLVFPRARGVTGFTLRARGFTAGALGHVVLAVTDLDDELFAHELVHVRQAERLGALLAPVYLGLLAVYGYARHPLERAARLAVRRRFAGGS
jgi:hypothetical protein